MNAMLDAALEYAELGFHPMPLNGKIPHQLQWQSRTLADPELIRQAWKTWPDANVGLRTGGGFIVLDVDSKNDGAASLDKLCEGRLLPETATAATGGGGWHYWFRVPASEAIGNRAGFRGLPGIDIRGKGGQVVVWPSIHPDTGREYVWTRHLRSGIADCPDWLLALLIPVRDREKSSDRETAPSPDDDPIKSDRESMPLLDDLRAGPAGDIADELIRKFPVPCYGHRNDLMVKCVGSVLGGHYDDATTIRAVSAWWVHYHDLGKVWTSPSEASTEIRKTIGVLRSSPRFVCSLREADHRSACREIVLDEDQIKKIKEKRTTPSEPNTKRGTLTRRRLCESLCNSGDEWAFVEGLIVHATHKAMVEPGDLIRMTDEQLCQIVADRHPAFYWVNKQFDRLKEKYITTLSKPATRFEMLVEVEKGDRKKGQAIGTPSIYQPTGILEFLGHPEHCERLI